MWLLSRHLSSTSQTQSSSSAATGSFPSSSSSSSHGGSSMASSSGLGGSGGLGGLCSSVLASLLLVLLLILPTSHHVTAFKIHWPKALQTAIKRTEEIAYENAAYENEVIAPPPMSRSLSNSYPSFSNVYQPSSVARINYDDWAPLNKYLRTDNSYSSKKRYRHWRPLDLYETPKTGSGSELAAEPEVDSGMDSRQEAASFIPEEDPFQNLVPAMPDPPAPTCSKYWCDPATRNCCSGMCVHVFGSDLCLLLPGRRR